MKSLTSIFVYAVCNRENNLHLRENKAHFPENKGHFPKNNGHFSEKKAHLRRTTEISHHKELYTLQHLRNNPMKFCSESNDR